MNDIPDSRPHRLFGSLRIRLLLGFTLASTVVFMAVATWVTSKAANLAEAHIAGDLRDTLVNGAAQVDGDELQALYQDLSSAPECDSPSGQTSGGGYYPDDPRYWDHVRWLETIHTIEPRAYVYTFIRGERPKELIFIGSNGATWEPKDGAPFCYHFIAHKIVRPNQGLIETTLAMDGYTDEWGHWVTGYTPITNSQGEVVAALGVDFMADEIVSARQAVVRPLAIAFVLAYLGLGVLLFVMSGYMTRPLRVLTSAARRIGEGEPVPELKRLQQPDFGSEIATLAHVLEESSTKRRLAEAAIEEQRSLAETLTQTAELLTSSLDLNTVLNSILGLAGRVVANDGAAIALGMNRTSLTVTINGLIQREDPAGTSRTVAISATDAKPLWEFIESLEAGLLNDQASYQVWRKTLNLKTSWLQSGVVAPIMVEEKTVGVLFLGSTQPSYYRSVDAVRLEAFANQASIAIANAWLARQLTEQKQELRQLSTRLIDTQESERKRIAQELHDAMGQTLTAIDINLATVMMELPPEVLKGVEERLSESRELADLAVQQVRELILDLRPTMLDDLGLIPTARWYIQRFAERANIEAALDLEDEHQRLPTEIETVLYRCLQESLTNIARHAEAHHLLVSLRWDEAHARLFIEDDGKGFDATPMSERDLDSYGMGLLGIQERVSALNGTFQIESVPGEGTESLIVIPLETDAPRPAENKTSEGVSDGEATYEPDQHHAGGA